MRMVKRQEVKRCTGPGHVSFISRVGRGCDPQVHCAADQGEGRNVLGIIADCRKAVGFERTPEAHPELERKDFQAHLITLPI
jgi:hypothetical protein